MEPKKTLSLDDFQLDSFSTEEAEQVKGGWTFYACAYAAAQLISSGIDAVLPTIDSYTSPYFSIGDRKAMTY